MWQGLNFLALLVALPIAEALFDDEIGQYEWILQQIGKPTALAYSAEAADRIFVASASGVVASVLLKDGAMQWRRVASTTEGLRILRAGSRGLISVTDKGFVQAWKGSTGDLTWQREYSDHVVDLVMSGPANKQNVIIIRESEVEARTMAGKHEWSTSSSQVGTKANFVASASSAEGSVCAVGAGSGGAGAAALQLQASDGKVLKKVDLPDAVAKGIAAGSFMVADSHLVFLTGDALSSHPLCGEGEVGEPFQMRKVNSADQAPFRLMPWQGAKGVFAATNGVTTAIFGIGPKGIKHLRTFEGVAVVGPVFSVHDDETGQPVAVAIVKEEGTQIQLLDPASGNVQPAIQAPGYTVGEHGDAQLLLVHELSSGEHRTLISASDHSLAGIQGTKVQWVREESLASIRQATFYSRSAAVSSADRASRATEPKGLAQLTQQLTELPALFGDLVNNPMDVVNAFVKSLTPKRFRKRKDMKLMPNVKVPTHAEELADFGADKLIIGITRAGKVFGIEATTSEIVWQKYLGTPGVECEKAGSSKTEIGGCSPWMQLLPSSAAAYSELLVIAATPTIPGTPKQPNQLLWIEPFTGNVLHKESAPAGVDIMSVMPLPRKGNAVQPIMPFLLVDSDRKVHTMPAGNVEVSRIVDDSTDRFFHYEVNSGSQGVEGFVVGKTTSSKPLVRLWNLELGSVGEKVVAAASPEHREWLHVPVHIKGDASILYKYINPNMVAVVSEDVRGNATSLNLYTLDAVTGHVLHQSHIPGGAQPVKLSVCDNWVVMHYRNPKKTRFELIVVEFFQSKSDDGPWDILFGGKGGSNATKSAHHLETPVPLQQTYIFPAGVTAMGVTATLKGITPRSIIMATTTEHVFRVSKDYLNPRRPYVSGAGKEDKTAIPMQFAPTKEEGVPPYAPVMPMKPTDILTYYNSMGQVDGIISSPTALESTSLVFTFGLDLFFMPVQTAKAYDVLSPGFNYVLLYASVGVVLLLFVVTSFWAKRKALQDRWR